MRAAARWMAEIDDAWEALEDAGEDLVVTVGQVATNPQEHAFSKVAGELDCCLDVRSISSGLLQRYDRIIHERAAAVESMTSTKVQFGPQTGSRPAAMDRGLIEGLCSHADARGIRAMEMPSGAGHDAAVFAHQGVRSAMIFVRNENGSHNPDEAMDLEDFGLGTRLLADILSAEDSNIGTAGSRS